MQQINWYKLLNEGNYNGVVENLNAIFGGRFKIESIKSPDEEGISVYSMPFNVMYRGYVFYFLIKSGLSEKDICELKVSYPFEAEECKRDEIFVLNRNKMEINLAYIDSRKDDVLRFMNGLCNIFEAIGHKENKPTEEKENKEIEDKFNEAAKDWFEHVYGDDKSFLRAKVYSSKFNSNESPIYEIRLRFHKVNCCVTKDFDVYTTIENKYSLLDALKNRMNLFLIDTEKEEKDFISNEYTTEMMANGVRISDIDKAFIEIRRYFRALVDDMESGLKSNS